VSGSDTVLISPGGTVQPMTHEAHRPRRASADPAAMPVSPFLNTVDMQQQQQQQQQAPRVRERGLSVDTTTTAESSGGGTAADAPSAAAGAGAAAAGAADGGAWTQLAPRSGHAAVFVSGRLIVLGGLSALGVPVPNYAVIRAAAAPPAAQEEALYGEGADGVDYTATPALAATLVALARSLAARVRPELPPRAHDAQWLAALAGALRDQFARGAVEAGDVVAAVVRETATLAAAAGPSRGQQLMADCVCALTDGMKEAAAAHVCALLLLCCVVCSLSRCGVARHVWPWSGRAAVNLTPAAPRPVRALRAR
jgi:hypothetical protein